MVSGHRSTYSNLKAATHAVQVSLKATGLHAWFGCSASSSFCIPVSASSCSSSSCCVLLAGLVFATLDAGLRRTGLLLELPVSLLLVLLLLLVLMLGLLMFGKSSSEFSPGGSAAALSGCWVFGTLTAWGSCCFPVFRLDCTGTTGRAVVCFCF